jgi:hypothetical protein
VGFHPFEEIDMRFGGFGLGGLVAALALGCGSSGGGGGSFTSSEPAGTMLSALTPAQAAQLCTDFNTYESQQLEAPMTSACKVAGVSGAEEAQSESTTPLTDAQLQAACAVVYADCMGPDGGLGNLDLCDSTTFAGEPSTCTSTVGDLQKCAGDLVTAESRFFGSFPSCGALTTANLASAEATLDADGGISDPPSCTMVETNCVSASTAAFMSPKTRGHRNK